MPKRENYVTIQGWMVEDLKLKGNELLVYALIYGFSQDGETEFKGSLGYIADWFCASEMTIRRALASLVEKKLLSKRVDVCNGVTFNYYKVLPPLTFCENGGNKMLQPPNKMLPNNNSNNTTTDIKDIVDYLNQKAGTGYKASTPKTQSLIKTRLKEGFTVDDFKKVIDNKVAEWKGTDMAQYLRPETLFGTKFEGYLNTRPARRSRPEGSRFNNYEQRGTDYDALIGQMYS